MTGAARLERATAMSFFADQPKAVYLVFGIEFWERFSYYGFLSILVLWLTATPLAGGLGWSKTSALLVVGYFVGAVWIAPIVGGWLADRWIGARRAILLGGIGLAAGNALLAAAAFLPGLILTPQALLASRIGVSDGSIDDRLIFALLAAGLVTMVVGAGLFKSNASSLLSTQFAPDDPRRGRAFTLFYMGINLGAIAAPLGAGTLGETVGWGYGFAAAALGMTTGVIMFASLAPRWLRQATTPAARPADAARIEQNRSGLLVVLALVPFAIVFWSGFLQYSGLVNLFTAEQVRRDAFGLIIPATWFLSINPAVILLGGPFVASLWARADARAGGDLFVTKVVVALLAMALAFTVLFVAAALDRGTGVSPLVIVVFWVLLTLGELSLMPAGLALIGRIAPPRLVGTLMGVWLMTLGVGGVVAGWIGAWAEQVGSSTVFAATAIGGGGAALLLILLAPVLQRRLGNAALRKGEKLP